MFKILMIGVCLTNLFSDVSNTESKNYGECVSPYGEPGICIHLPDCPPLYAMVLSGSPSEHDADYLKRSQCGFDNTQRSDLNRKILTCCPHKKDEIEPGNILPKEGTCGKRFDDKIYGGNQTGIYEFPWMALIQYKKPDNTLEFICGGALINSRYILTAAHCVKGSIIIDTWELYNVRLGEWNLETNPDCVLKNGVNDCAPPHVDMRIEKTIVHENYDTVNEFNDIALLRTAESVVYHTNLRPICLPTATDLRSSLFSGAFMSVAGWGLTQNKETSSVNLKIVVEIQDIKKCQKQYNTLFNVIMSETQQLCAGGKDGVDTCRGDSGGPLMVTKNIDKTPISYVAGLVSYGSIPCGLKYWPGIYTRVGNYIDWIQSKLQP